MKQQNLFSPNNHYDTIVELERYKARRIHPGESVLMEFNTNLFYKKYGDQTEYRFRFIGEVDIPPKWREEPSYPILYRRIGESLRMEEDVPILQMCSSSMRIPRCAYYKIYGDEVPETEALDFSFTYRTGHSTQMESAGAQIEVFYRSEPPRDYDQADADVRIQIPLEPSEAFREVTRKVPLEKPVDFIVVSLLAERFTGEIDWKTPQVVCGGNNLVETFRPEPLELKTPRWVGENLSKIEWPCFELVLNGEPVFHGSLFDRIFRRPAFEISVDASKLKLGKNRAELRLVQEYEGQKDFLLNKTEMVCAPGEGVLAYDRDVHRGRMPVLIKTAAPNTVVTLESRKAGIEPERKTCTFAEPGLHGVSFFVKKAFSGSGELSVQIGETAYPLVLDRFLEKTEDVLTGTGDAIYINLNWADFSQFAAWYFANGLGNMMTLRTSYRWSGSQCSQEGFWEKLQTLLEELGIRHNVMVDGRELPNSTTNGEGFSPEDSLFDGFQAHEQDGAYNYWGSTQVPRGEEFFHELVGRRLKRQGMLPCGRIVRKGTKYLKHFDGEYTRDMKEAAEYFLRNISRAQEDCTRHTGPSVLYKYFAQSGMEWLGAELMYGTLDPCVAALRGASRAYGKESFGGHLAIQWSSTPHNTIARYRRYLLGLYASYLNGLDQINTEEGCWRLEEHEADFERNSTACMNHMDVQNHFTRFVKTHTRRGKLKTNIGLVQGRYDGFSLFGRGPVWGQAGMPYGAPEQSWQQMSVFYPGMKIGSVYKHPCLSMHQGYFTSTPYGQVDLVPEEGSLEFLSRYPYLALMGWNTADEAFAAKMLDYVKQGGMLVLAWPHLYTTTSRQEAISHRAKPLFNETVAQLLGVKSVPEGGVAPRLELTTGEYEGRQHGASQDRLVVRNKVGKGRVLLVNAFAYPSEKPVKAVYATLLRELAQASAYKERAKGWVSTKDWISTAVYDGEDRRVIYLLDVKWWKAKKRPEKATLHLGKAQCTIPVRRDVLNILTLFGDIGVMTQDETTDVMDLQKTEEGNLLLTVQGFGNTVLRVFQIKNGVLRSRELHADLQGVMEAEFAL